MPKLITAGGWELSEYTTKLLLKKYPLTYLLRVVMPVAGICSRNEDLLRPKYAIEPMPRIFREAQDEFYLFDAPTHCSFFRDPAFHRIQIFPDPETGIIATREDEMIDE